MANNGTVAAPAPAPAPIIRHRDWRARLSTGLLSDGVAGIVGLFQASPKPPHVVNLTVEMRDQKERIEIALRRAIGQVDDGVPLQALYDAVSSANKVSRERVSWILRENMKAQVTFLDATDESGRPQRRVKLTKEGEEERKNDPEAG